MTSYTERSKASRKGKASQYSFHVAKVENWENGKSIVIHSYKTLKTAQKHCEHFNTLAKCNFEYAGLKPYYHYEVVID